MADNAAGTPGNAGGQAGVAAPSNGDSAPSGEQNPFDFGDTPAPTSAKGQGEAPEDDGAAKAVIPGQDENETVQGVLEQFGNDPAKIAKSFVELRGLMNRQAGELGQYRQVFPQYKQALEQRDQILARMNELAGPEIKAIIQQKLNSGTKIAPAQPQNSEEKPLTKAEMLAILQERESSREQFLGTIESFKTNNPGWEQHKESIRVTMEKHPVLAELVIDGKIPLDVVLAVAKGMNIGQAITQAKATGLKEGMSQGRARKDARLEGPSLGVGGGGNDPWADLK